jgi:beta-lactamase regulating signal transducer with metallopeptidase domain
MACTPFLMKRYAEKWLYYAWLVVVIGLIIPFRPRWNITPVFQIGNAAQIENGAIIPPMQMMGENIYFSAPAISWFHIAAIVWFAGIITFLAYHAARHYRFVKMTKRWSVRVTDEQTLDLLQSLKKEMGITKRIDLNICASAGSPMLIGLFKPRIFIPTAKMAHDELRHILKHELVHYKRKDILYKYLVLAATAANWFNPVVYLATKEIANLCEMSCDVEVVKNADADTRQFYCEAIIGVVRYQSKLKTALSTNYYGGKKGMKQRISSIMSTSNKNAGVVVACMALVITLGTGFVFAAPPTVNENVGTLVPLRTITEELGADVRWDPSTQTVTAEKDGITLTLEIGSDSLTRNGEQIALDEPAQIVDETILVPIRAIAENLGIVVD